MKWIAFFLFLAMIIGCTDRQNVDLQKDKKGIQLTYWCAPNPREIKVAKEMVAEWNQQHPDVQVFIQPIPASASSEEVLLAAIAGGTTPDICSNIWPGAMDDFTSSGGLVPLDTFPDFFPLLNARVPRDMMEFFQSKDGHFYQIPWKTNPIMMIYNKGIFRKANVVAPLPTYSDYFSAAKKIVVDDDNDGFADQWMLYRNIKPIWWQRLFDYYPLYIGASGGKTLFKGDSLLFNNSASVKVFSFMQKLYKKGYCPVTEFQGDQFLNERLATQITGPWMISYIEKFKQKGFEYGIMPIPVPDDLDDSLRYTYGDHKNISIFSTTKHPDQAWAFVKTLISKEADLRLLETASQIPIRTTLTTDSIYQDYFKRNPMMLEFARQAPYTRGVDGISDLKEILDAVTQEYEACVIYDRKTPKKAITDAAQRVKVIMEWNRD